MAKRSRTIDAIDTAASDDVASTLAKKLRQAERLNGAPAETYRRVRAEVEEMRDALQAALENEFGRESLDVTTHDALFERATAFIHPPAKDGGRSFVHKSREITLIDGQQDGYFVRR